MALESATYINQLVTTNPTLADPKSQGDDHLRMIKRVLQQTFPNLTGAVTTTQAQLNKVADPTVFVVPNMVLMWAGSIASIPAGWLLCNGAGTTSTGLAVPNLLDRFIVGAGYSYGMNNSGGVSTHSHGIIVGGTALTVAQMPSHTHDIVATQFDGTNGAQAYMTTDNAFGNYNITSTATGSGATHTHTAVSGSVSNLPPYYALAYIIKN